MLSCVRFHWPVLRCPSLAGFGVYPEGVVHGNQPNQLKIVDDESLKIAGGIL